MNYFFMGSVILNNIKAYENKIPYVQHIFYLSPL